LANTTVEERNREVIVSNKYIGNEKDKISLSSKVLLVALALAVIVGLGSAAYGTSDNTDNKTNILLLKPMGIFDPFTLKSTRVTVTRSVSENERYPGLDLNILLAEMKYARPSIRIPYRPVLRSPFRPPLLYR